VAICREESSPAWEISEAGREEKKGKEKRRKEKNE
jgi:hypothetical protein